LKNSRLLLFFVFATITTLAVAQEAQQAQQGTQEEKRFSVMTPSSSLEFESDHGLRAHTNHVVRIDPDAGVKPLATSPQGETPQSIYPVYNLSFTGAGGSRAIAIVDAFHYPTAAADLATFSTQFGLPQCTVANGCFHQVFARGTQPAGNCGWNQEAALDIEWAHAMAPNAKIILVEAASSSFTDLFQAVDIATSQVTSVGGGGEVSMSWGGSEFSGEGSNDTHFQHTGIVYIASSGDTGGVVIYPSASPFVVSAGGTTIHRTNGTFTSETGWSGSGGGASSQENRPSYQVGVANASTTRRSTPDFSFDADPNSGVSVFDSTVCNNASGWLVFGGTSVAAPSLAGIINRVGNFFSSSTAELTTIYGNRTNTADFRDILTGTAGRNRASAGYDFVTGVGSSLGTGGK
jgi:kumamolisin